MEIYLPNKDVNIKCFEDNTIPGVCLLIINDALPNFRIDERNNTIGELNKGNLNPSIRLYIIEKFNKLKQSNIEYGDLNGIYSPKKHIFVRDFLKYLKVESRDDIINEIIT